MAEQPRSNECDAKCKRAAARDSDQAAGASREIAGLGVNHKDAQAGERGRNEECDQPCRQAADALHVVDAFEIGVVPVPSPHGVNHTGNIPLS